MFATISQHVEQYAKWFRLLGKILEDSNEPSLFLRDIESRVLEKDIPLGTPHDPNATKEELISDLSEFYINKFLKWKWFDQSWQRPPRQNRNNGKIGYLRKLPEPRFVLSKKGRKAFQSSDKRLDFLIIQKLFSDLIASNFDRVKNVVAVFGMAFTIGRVIVRLDDLVSLAIATVLAVAALVASN